MVNRQVRVERALARRRKHRSPDADLDAEALARLNRAKEALGLTESSTERNQPDGH
ncbi:hypothetical protein [Microbacterium sp. C7(2022)]|uniref:hypothetical protein n=1 Tax=Microbacterium sp. C7(2022) TaxID=2992759 RepID=UPI00237C501F|nr:hypothetical protein [Microbacterium sp. C7(2022)]MDE0545485.1 hypothetical protein [Microbacterium sp. C7(2022)]